MKFKTKPVEIEAVQWKCDNYEEVSAFTGDALRVNNNTVPCEIAVWTRKGYITIQCKDWVIKDARGEFYRFKPDVFEATYDQVEETT